MNVSAEKTQALSTQLLRILVVDDHDLVRQGLRSMLDTQPGWAVCGEAGTGHELKNNEEKAYKKTDRGFTLHNQSLSTIAGAA